MANETDGWFGGRVTFTFGGQPFTLAEAAVKLSPALYDVSAKANQDGTAAYEAKPELVGADMTFRNAAAIDWTKVNMQTGNATIVEDTNGRTHMFTGTRLIGKPDVDVSTGDVTGLKLAGGTYSKLGTS
jgi:hypothetical protein